MKTNWHKSPGTLLAIGGVLLNVIPIFFQSLDANHRLSQAGLAMFLAGVVVEITDIRKRSAEAESDLAEIKALTGGIDAVINTALPFGTALSGLLEILTNAEREDVQRFVHIRAGEKLLRDHVVEFIPSFVRRLRDLQTTRATFELREPYFINDVLSNLKDSLPLGCVWFGVTHLAEGWLEDKADPGYYGFADGMRRRSKNGELQVFRIYCLGAGALSEEMQDHLSREAAAGISVRVLTQSKDCPEDLSLIWSPPGEKLVQQLTSADNPIEILRKNRVSAICGMKFVTRQGRSLDALEISAPECDDFQPLEQQFVKSWAKATPFTPAKT
jgi:hypothetical protein